MATITLAGIQFPTKGAARAELARIRDEAGPRFIRRGSGDEFDLLEAAFLRHPSPEKRLPGPVVMFHVIKNEGSGHGVVAVDDDGNRMVFSVSSAVTDPTSSEPPLRARVREALRYALVEQTDAIRRDTSDERGCVTCTRCGAEGDAYGAGFQLDHTDDRWEFAALLSAWLEACDLTLDEIAVRQRHSGLWEVADPEILASWLITHRLGASLQVLCTPCHTQVTAERRHRRALASH